MMNILVVAAHPDDEVLGCGGSIAKWAKAGHAVQVVILAEGATSRDSVRDRESRVFELSCLKSAAYRAGDILGAVLVHVMDMPDNRMDSLDRLDVIKAIEREVERVKPEMVVTHHAGDVNIDHQITHEAVVTACRPQPGNIIKTLLAFEVPSSTEWQVPGSAPMFNPNYFVDITIEMGLKMQALEEYVSEMREWPHSRSLNAVEHLARWRGASVGSDAAEAFQLLRALH
jgi:LmbE family N-acetylglucosaminyl deacetylase